MENIEAEELDLLIGRLRRRYPMLPVDAVREEIERMHRHADDGARDFLAVLIAREVAEIRGNDHLAG